MNFIVPPKMRSIVRPDKTRQENYGGPGCFVSVIEYRVLYKIAGFFFSTFNGSPWPNFGLFTSNYGNNESDRKRSVGRSFTI